MNNLKIYWNNSYQKEVVLGDDIGAKLLFGSSEDADQVFRNKGVSSLHCLIRQNKDAVTIKDLKSTNGTWINGQRIKKSSSLKSGDLIQIGYITMIFCE